MSIAPPRACTLAIAVFFAGGACGEPHRVTESDAPIGSVQQAIQGGAIDPVDSYSVGICAGAGPDGCVFRCSGTLITPNLVATVRHCIFATPSAQIDCAKDTFGPALGPPGLFWVTTQPEITVARDRWHQSRSFVVPASTAVCGSDIAFLILDDNVAPWEAVPATPAISFSLLDRARAGTRVTAIGYGYTDPAATGDIGKRRILRDVPLRCIPHDPTLGCASVLGTLLTEKEFLAGDGLCQGDSGSGAFAQTVGPTDSPLLLGVLTRGGEDGVRCLNGVYTRLDAWATLIAGTAQRAAAIGAYEVPAWARIEGTGPFSGEDKRFPPRSLGAECNDNAQCDSAQCASPDTGVTWRCTRACQPSARDCGSGFYCGGTDASGFCFPLAPATARADDDCAFAPARAGAGSEPLVAAGIVVVSWWRRRRRRREAPS